jgi:hypothetical protein
MLIEPNVLPLGACIHPVIVRYGFGGESELQAAANAARTAATAKRRVDMTAESARSTGAVQGSPLQ